MLYQLGPVTLDTFPLSIHEVERETGADYAPKDLVGTMRDREWVGEADFVVTLKGKILPSREPMPGGLILLDVLHGMRTAGLPIFVMRGDFLPMGWFVVESIKEAHEFIGANGVGMMIGHEIKMTKVRSFWGADAGYTLIGSIISLFG